MAIPLTRYLGAEGSYEGFDIVAEGIEWCQTQITRVFLGSVSRSPTSTTACIVQTAGSKRGITSFHIQPSRSISFFSHRCSRTCCLLDIDITYARSRASFAPAVAALMTCFLLNDEVRQLVARGKSSLPMREQKEGYSTIDAARPEYDIALPQPYVASLLESAGLIVAPPIHYGKWCGRAAGLTYQDVILVRKGA